ncbi:MAG: xanthine dehydrogenase family protein subunit M [Dehalococcoidia bacterium]
MRRFDYYAPGSLSEALSILQERGDGGKLLAGGTDLLVQMREAGLHPSYVVSLRRLPELRGIEFDEGTGLRIGACADMAAIEAHPSVRQRYRALFEGASLIGSVQTRNMATIGGNICNAAPSADSAPPLTVLGAGAEVAGPGGRREMALEDLFTGPGTTALGPNDILMALRLPVPPPHTGSVYQRHTPRQEMDIAVVGVGVALTFQPDGEAIQGARIGLGAVAPTPIRAREAEDALTGQRPSEELFARAAELAVAASRPISDVRGSAAFRRELVRVMTRRCLGIALERAQTT